ncbi:hypothetical protein SLEP1_g34812 [Rubroshorea leprosula]|uniref:Ribosomal protein S18 n=1 Tax=Rubroshorea leprosula TaxID=152421 RepID=A0AAV5KL87_9ROSI|nr:hypothetical protein SLEP1_g34812 [Rubroshorea leprosula]
MSSFLPRRGQQRAKGKTKGFFDNPENRDQNALVLMQRYNILSLV